MKLADIKARYRLRDEGEDLAEMMASISKRGILQPLWITPDGLLIDGYRRYLAAQALRMEEVPVVETKLTDMQVLAQQLIVNSCKPHEQSRQLRRMLAQDIMITARKLAGLCMIGTWQLAEILYPKATEAVKEAAANEPIPAANIYALAQLPIDEQQQYLQDARTEKPDSFIPRMNAIEKEARRCASKTKWSLEREKRIAAAAIPIHRQGWDNVTINGRLCYLRDNIIVSFTDRYWIISHPVLHLEDAHDFHTALDAMKFVEGNL